MKGSRTRRVGTLWVQALIERASFDRFANWGPVLVAIPLNSLALFLQTLNRGSEPLSNCFFGLALGAVPIERI